MFTLAILMFLLLVVLLLLGMPVAIVLGVVSVLFLIFSGQPLQMVPSKIYSEMNAFVLMAIPFFILAGEIMNKTGITDNIIKFVNNIVGRFRGGLAQANIFTSILFAGITGAAVSDVSALGSVFIPAMEKQGYKRSFSATLTAASSIIGPTIPPSIIIVMYAAVTQVSVGGLFAATIIPGLILGISQSIYVIIISRYYNFPKFEIKLSLKEFAISFKDSILALITPFIILGGILGGVFTPTEAAAIAVLYALILGVFIYRSMSLKDIYSVTHYTVRISAILLFIIGVAGILGWIISLIGLPLMMTEFFLSFTDNTHIIFILVMLLMIFVGTWLDNGPACIILAPILAPMMTSLGIHPLHFGTLMIISLNIGLITPPLGICLFAACAVGNVKFEAIAIQIIPFLLIDFIVIILLIFLPSLSLYLPKLLGFY
jgi:tripartite ATP-independent transporter DctM subunit